MVTPMKPAPKPLAPPPNEEQLKRWGEANGLQLVKDIKSQSRVAMMGNLDGQPFKLAVLPGQRDYLFGKTELRMNWRFRVTGGLVCGIASRPLFKQIRSSSFSKDETEEERVLKAFDEGPSPNALIAKHYAIYGNMPERVIEWLDEDIVKTMLFWPGSSYKLGQPFLMQVLGGQMSMFMQINEYPIMALAHALRLVRTAGNRAAKVFGMTDN